MKFTLGSILLLAASSVVSSYPVQNISSTGNSETETKYFDPSSGGLSLENLFAPEQFGKCEDAYERIYGLFRTDSIRYFKTSGDCTTFDDAFEVSPIGLEDPYNLLEPPIRYRFPLIPLTQDLHDWLPSNFLDTFLYGKIECTYLYVLDEE